MSTEIKKKPVSNTMMAFRLSALEFFGKICENMSAYTVLFLQNLGYKATQVSLVQSLLSLVGIFAPTIWGIISDKRKTVKWILLICFVVSGFLYPFIPKAAAITLCVFQWELPLVLFLAPLDNFFRMPARQLYENYVVRTSYDRKLNFGLIRAFGSFSFAATGMVLGKILDQIGGPLTTFWLYPISLVPVLILCASINDKESFKTSDKKKLSFKEMNFGALFKNYYYIVFLFYSIVLYLPMGASQTFLSFHLADLGFSPSVFATVSGIRAATEIPLMLVFRKLQKRIPLQNMLIFAALIFGVESILLRFVTTELSIILVCSLHGFGNSINLTAAANYIYVLAPNNLKATAQTLNGAAASVAGILAPLIGGVVVEAIGAGSFFFICGIVILCAGFLFILSFIIGAKILHKKAPGITA